MGSILIAPAAGRAAEFQPYAEGKLQYDGNLFRTANGVATPAGQSANDWSYTALAGLAAEVESGDLIARVGGSASRNWYSRNSYLDFAGYSLAGLVKKDGPAVQLSLDGQQDRRLSRSEERRAGKECVSTCRSRWSPYQ